MMAKKAPNPIDKHVGSRVRMRRMMLGMSQEKLGDSLGLTFQQVQKYEKGTNRIGASRLQQISQILQVPVSFFFDGAPAVGRLRIWTAWARRRRRPTSRIFSRRPMAWRSPRLLCASRTRSCGGALSISSSRSPTADKLIADAGVRHPVGAPAPTFRPHLDRAGRRCNNPDTRAAQDAHRYQTR